MIVELEHESPRIGKVKYDSRKQRPNRPDLVFLEILKENRLGRFKKEIVRPKLRRVRADGT